VDARSPARLLDLPGPQRRGTGGTLNLIRSPVRSEPPGQLVSCRLRNPSREVGFVVTVARAKGAGDERLRRRLCLGAASPRI
jgi:hypothetical protein